MPLDQLLLHLSNSRFRTRLLDRAAHCYNKACASDQLWCKDLRMIEGDVYATFSHHIYDDRVDPHRGYCAGALRVHPVFLGECLCHLASSRILNTDKEYGTLSQPWASRRICRQVRQLNLQLMVLSSKHRDS